MFYCVQYFGTLGIEFGNFIHDNLRAAVYHFFIAVWVLYGELECFLINVLCIYTPALGGVGKFLLQFYEFGKVVVVQRICFAEVAAGVKLVIPGLSRLYAFLKEKHNGFYTCTLERPAWTIENCIQVAAFQ